MPRPTVRYLQIADQIMEFVAAAPGTSDVRIPSERDLTEMYGAHRDTVRRALRHLRERRHIYTSKRGTFAYAPRSTPLQTAARDPRTTASTQLTYERMAHEIPELFGLEETCHTLVLRHRVFRDSATLVRCSTSYFAPSLLASVPRFKRLSRTGALSEPTTLRDINIWLLDAGVRPARPRIVRSRTTDPPDGWSWARTLVHDQHGRLLAVTDLGRLRDT
ncbi:GntR family transcriptional regulator [Streptomyces sp. NPDC048641]|uniref:GntR family transcriptional regulator n=1 Tax=Streptomyces sp. NPDC048641 TaxID=3154825 RepID=UPI0034295798